MRALVIIVLLLLSVLPAGSSQPAPDASQVETWLRDAEQHLRTSGFDEARRLFTRARDAAVALEPKALEVRALCGMGDLHFQLAEYADAREFFTQCLQAAEREQSGAGIGRASLGLSGTLELLGQRPESEASAERALEAFAQVGDRRGHAAALLQLVRVSPKRRAAPEPTYAQVVDEARAIGDAGIEGRALHSWGDYLFTTSRYEESFDKLQQALRVFEAAGHTVALGRVHNSLGRLYRAHGRYDEALKSQLKALDLHQAAGAPFELMQSLNAVGAVYTYLNDPRALEYQEKALALAEQTSSPRIQDFVRGNIAGLLFERGEYARAEAILEGIVARRLDTNLAARYVRLSQARLQLGKPADALDAADKALAECRAGTVDCVLPSQLRAAALRALGRHREALSELRATLASLEAIRTKLVAADFLRQNFHHARQGVYSETIALQLLQKLDGDALETAELARARAFLDLLASRDVTLSAAPATAADVVAIAQRLRSTFLLYWVDNESISAWVVAPDGTITTRRTPLLYQRLLQLVRASAPGEDRWKGGTEAWSALYDLLIAPVRSALPARKGALLTIVPHGPLHNVSFAALKDRRGRYLLEDFTIHYVPAASVLSFSGKRAQRSQRDGPALIVADPALPPGSRLDLPLDRLPGARAEGRAIATLLPPQRRIVLEGAAATETEVRRHATGKAIVHFATHAMLRDDEPLAAFLALGAPGTKEDDGRLTAAEVYGMRLHADLVVLSACRTGSGVVTGDGIATFARAFISAGSPSVIVSHWDVPDEPSNRLIPAFYRGWLAGTAKAAALRSAQLRLLTELRAGRVEVSTAAGPVLIPEHPVFWAGYALIGEPH